MKVNLENKVAIITGAAGGIGSEMARMFARNGADVVIADLNEAGAQKVVEEIQQIGRKSIFVKTNVGDQKDAVALADRVATEFGKIDILINNAGINVSMKERGPIHVFPDEMWKKILNVDLDGVYYCSKAVLKYMVEKKYGKIINISSIAGAVPLRNQCAFDAAKAGVINLTKAMAAELAPFGINVNVILPGSTMIPGMVAEGGLYKDGRYESIMSHIPMGRPGTPEDVGYGALYLASDVSNYVTGNSLVIDGGWTCGFTRDW